MASYIYPKAKEAFLQAEIDVPNDTLRAALVDTGQYTYDAGDEFLSDVPGGAVQETSDPIAAKTTLWGTFDCDDIVWEGTSGSPCNAVVVYQDTGVAATSRLVCYLEAAYGMPVTPGGDITAIFDEAGVFTLGTVYTPPQFSKIATYCTLAEIYAQPADEAGKRAVLVDCPSGKTVGMWRVCRAGYWVLDGTLRLDYITTDDTLGAPDIYGAGVGISGRSWNNGLQFSAGARTGVDNGTIRWQLLGPGTKDSSDFLSLSGAMVFRSGPSYEDNVRLRWMPAYFPTGFAVQAEGYRYCRVFAGGASNADTGGHIAMNGTWKTLAVVGTRDVVQNRIAAAGFGPGNAIQHSTTIDGGIYDDGAALSPWAGIYTEGSSLLTGTCPFTIKSISLNLIDDPD